jgi:hypothetical protein
VGVMTKRDDGLEIVGEARCVNLVLEELQKVFGERKLTWGMFANCGVQHTQDVKTKEINLDQIHYASNAKCVARPQLSTAKAEDDAVPELHQLYMSLLGAVAYRAHIRVDVLVFVSALQRRMRAPKVDHVRALDKLLRWIQRHPKKLSRRRFKAS